MYTEEARRDGKHTPAIIGKGRPVLMFVKCMQSRMKISLVQFCFFIIASAMWDVM
jgi:hypothetical protein